MLNDGAGNDGGELLSQLLELYFEIRNPGLARPQLGAIRGEFLHQDIHVLPRIGERAFAHARGQIPFLLPQFHGVSVNLGVAAQLVEVRARRAVLDLGRLQGESQRLFPLRNRGVRKLGGQSGEGDGIARVQCRLVLPELLHAGRDVIGGAAAERLAHGFNRGPFARGHQ